MFSKRLLALSLAIGWALGCGLNTGENAPSRTPPSYSGAGFSCVGKIPEHFDLFVNDQLSEQQITDFVRCLQKAFTTFAQLTRGRDATTYTPDEIRRFLHEFFLGDKRISDELLRQFMVIKQTMVGGDSERISRAELYTAVEILEELRTEAIRLKPHIPVLNPKMAVKQDPAHLGERLAEADAALRHSIQVISSRLQKSKKSYPLVNLHGFLVEFRRFIGWEDHFQEAIPVDDWVNFLRVFRQITVAPNQPDVVRPEDWVPLLQSLSNWYLVFLQYEVGVKNQPVLSGSGLQNTKLLAREVFKLTEQSILQQDGGTVTFEQFDDLTQAVQKLHWLPEKVRPSSVQTALRGLITRVLGNPDVPAGRRKSRGLRIAELVRARELFDRWADVQDQIEINYGKDRSAQNRSAPNLKMRPVMNTAVRSKLQSLAADSDWDEFLRVRDLIKRPLFPDELYRIWLIPENQSPGRGVRLEFGFHNLSIMNLLRSGTSLIFRGYAEKSASRTSWDSGITSDEMQAFYSDFREIGIDIGFVDKRNVNTGSRAFIEGNLFTYASDGLVLEDDGPRSRLTFIETMELFAFLYSGGAMASDMYDDLQNKCENGPLDLNDKPKLRRACVLARLPELLDGLLVNMPGLRQFLRISPEEVRQNYARTMLETAFSPLHSHPEWVEANELSTLAVVLHYSEAVMTRYDVNRDGLLTNSEIGAAVEVFRGFIKKFAKEKLNRDLSDRQAAGAFYYILTYKEMPSSWTDIFWPSYISVGKLSLNRYELSTVFRVIIAKLFDTPVKKTEVKAPDPVPAPCHGFDIIIPPNCGSVPGVP